MVQFDHYVDDYKTLLDNSLSLVGGFDEYYLHRKVDIVRNVIGSKKIKSILDFGCGLGDTSLMLRDSFPHARIVGVDISEISIEHARTNNKDIDFYCLADQKFIASYAGYFDLIYVANVFHHIPCHERQTITGLLNKLMSVSGQICVFEHNPYNPLTNLVVSRCEFDQDAILLFSRDSRMLLEYSGFQVERTVYFLFFPYMFRKLSKIEAFLSWLPLGAQYCVVASLK